MDVADVAQILAVGLDEDGGVGRGYGHIGGGLRTRQHAVRTTNFLGA